MIYIYLLMWVAVGALISLISWPGLDCSWFERTLDNAKMGEYFEAGADVIAGLFLWPILVLAYLVTLIGLIIAKSCELYNLIKENRERLR